MLIKKDVLVEPPSTRISVDVEITPGDCAALLESLTTEKAEELLLSLIKFRFTDREEAEFSKKLSDSLWKGLTI